MLQSYFYFIHLAEEDILMRGALNGVIIYIIYFYTSTHTFIYSFPDILSFTMNILATDISFSTVGHIGVEPGRH